MPSTRSKWPGVVASLFVGRAMHLEGTVTTSNGTTFASAVCGAGSGLDLTSDVTQVSCLRCFKTRAYKTAADAELGNS